AMWVFGYGSLIWKVDFPIEKQVHGRISGYVRRFWQGSADHRGTPETPGRVLTLIPYDEWHSQFRDSDPHPAESVWGVCYKVPDDQADKVRKHLDYREKNGYDALHIQVLDKEEQVLVEDALLYLGTTMNEMFLGPGKCIEDIAQHIFESAGESGDNKSYLYELDDALRDRFGVCDQHICDLARLVRALDSKPPKPCTGNHSSKPIKMAL
ncbi:hypothetical protein BATDEDRAFT_13865, partial [Batrachochytrium dendrobatidis JAM81]